MKFSKSLLCSFLIVIFHFVGFLGFSIEAYVPLFKLLVPFHLLLMIALLIISHPDRNRNFGIFLIVTYLAGYFIEFAGVHTGVIFGEYFYETTLGFKIAEIPLMIGVNWILVIYSVGVFARRMQIKDDFLASAIGAAFVTGLDYLIEPIAVKFDYWDWTAGAIPFQNYLAWFLFSFVLLLIFYKLPFKKENGAGSTLFITQLLFFAALNINAA